MERGVPCGVRRSAAASGRDARPLVLAGRPRPRPGAQAVSPSTGARRPQQPRRQGAFRRHLIGQHGRQIQDRKCGAVFVEFARDVT